MMVVAVTVLWIAVVSAFCWEAYLERADRFLRPGTGQSGVLTRRSGLRAGVTHESDLADRLLMGIFRADAQRQTVFAEG